MDRPKFPGRRNVPGGRTWAHRGPRGRRATGGAALMRRSIRHRSRIDGLSFGFSGFQNLENPCTLQTPFPSPCSRQRPAKGRNSWSHRTQPLPRPHPADASRKTRRRLGEIGQDPERSVPFPPHESPAVQAQTLTCRPLTPHASLGWVGACLGETAALGAPVWASRGADFKWEAEVARNNTLARRRACQLLAAQNLPARVRTPSAYEPVHG